MPLRIVGISSSPRHGNTEHLVRAALAAAEEAPVEVSTELLSFVGKRIEPCSDCQVCAKQRRPCIKQDDWQAMVSRITDPIPDGIVIASPVYFFSVNAQLRAFFERFTSLVQGQWVDDFPLTPPDFSRTAAVAIAVGYHRHGGVEHAMSCIIDWFLTVGCVCTGADYIGGGAWQQHQNALDAVASDEIGMLNARVAGRNVAYLAYLLRSGAGADSRAAQAMLSYRNSERRIE